MFGWSSIDMQGRFRIPDAALEEYGFLPGERIFLLTASRASGGFIIARHPVISRTILFTMIDTVPGLADFRAEEGRAFTSGNRKVCWTTIDGHGHLVLPPETLGTFGVRPGDKLLAVRGSYAGLSLVVRGPMVEEAERHPEVEVFEVDNDRTGNDASVNGKMVQGKGFEPSDH